MIPATPSPSEAEQISGQLAALNANRRFQNLTAQSHSREIMQRLRISRDAWPRYTQFEDDLHYTAHFLLWQALQLKGDPAYGAAADEYIKRGCEILEFLYGQAATGTADRLDQIFNAALGYYISGYYARSYVLMRDLELGTELPQELELIRNLLQKNFSGTRQSISRILLDPAYSDAEIAANMRNGVISSDEALDRILRASLNRAFSYLLEYPKTGLPSLIETARAIIGQGVDLSLRTGFADWWWIFYCARFLLDEYSSNSLWTVLSPLNGDDKDGSLVGPYIRANYSRPGQVVELWRSQTAAFPKINDAERMSYCIKMPTSAGKTRIAEIAILRFLLDSGGDSTTKCLYVAPFRSLAVEVENSLKDSFHPLGIRVSELYGGFELSPIERMQMDETRIVVATPEKLDAFLRTNPEYVDQVRLVIIDEGHIINLSDRGIHYEFFVERLLRFLRPKNVRFFFLSAVLPNMDEFSEWIAGDPANVIDKDWRPSRLLLGNLVWEQHRAKIEYLESDHAPLGHECFVNNFLVPLDLKRIGSRRRKPYPDEISEVVAETSLRFAQLGTTMVFCTRKVSVEPMARQVKQALVLHSKLAAKGEPPLALDVPGRYAGDVQDCIMTANEYMGNNNEVAVCLQDGFAIHHADIPKAVRIKLENLIRKRAVKLIIASATLAQGVNLPIQTVLVYGLSHGQDDDLTPLTFWNICGRAGRGMQENEGQILFAVDLEMPNVKLVSTEGLSPRQITRRTNFKRSKRIEMQNNLRTSIVRGYNTYRVMSSLITLLAHLKKEWQSVHGNVDVAAMCMHLAENDTTWLNQRPDKTNGWLDTLDQELLALLEEANIEAFSPDALQSALGKSLAFLQLRSQSQLAVTTGATDQLGITADELIEFLNARVTYISRVIPDRTKRTKYYKLGLPLKDCQKIEAAEKSLGELLISAQAYQSWEADQRCAYLAQLAEFLLGQIGALAPHDSTALDCWKEILELWLRGNSPNEIALDAAVVQCVSEPTEISAFIEDAFVYKLPRGLNALTSYFASIAKETGLILPTVISYFTALVKYGVHDPVASCLLAFNLTSRKLALNLARYYAQSQVEPSEVLFWFLDLNSEQLEPLGFSSDEIVSIQATQKWSRSLRHKKSAEPESARIQMLVAAGMAAKLAEGDVVLVHPWAEISPHMVSVETLSGDEIGRVELDRDVPIDWRIPHRVCANVGKKQAIGNEQTQVEVRVMVL